MSTENETVKIGTREGAAAPLVGGRIVAAWENDDPEFPTEKWTAFAVKVGGTVYVVEVSRDPEGNGPGALFLGKAEVAR